MKDDLRINGKLDIGNIFIYTIEHMLTTSLSNVGGGDVVSIYLQ